jgi:hypothetical protein
MAWGIYDSKNFEQKLYRTQETEGSRPAMKTRRNKKADLSCK